MTYHEHVTPVLADEARPRTFSMAMADAQHRAHAQRVRECEEAVRRLAVIACVALGVGIAVAAAVWLMGGV